MVCKNVQNQHLCWWLGCLYRRSIYFLKKEVTDLKNKEKSNELILQFLHFFPHKLATTKTVDRWRKKDTTWYQSAQKKYFSTWRWPLQCFLILNVWLLLCVLLHIIIKMLKIHYKKDRNKWKRLNGLKFVPPDLTSPLITFHCQPTQSQMMMPWAKWYNRQLSRRECKRQTDKDIQPFSCRKWILIFLLFSNLLMSHLQARIGILHVSFFSQWRLGAPWFTAESCNMSCEDYSTVPGCDLALRCVIYIFSSLVKHC